MNQTGDAYFKNQVKASKKHAMGCLGLSHDVTIEHIHFQRFFVYAK